MTQPTKPEPTQADKDKSKEFVRTIRGLSLLEQFDYVASELAAVREGAILESNPMFIADKDGNGINFTAAIQAAHSAGAAEMKEWCVSALEELADNTKQLYKNTPLDAHDNYLAGLANTIKLYEHIIVHIRDLSPNPNYLAEIKAGVREECAKVSCWLCLQGYAVYRDESVKGSLIESAHAWKHRLSVSGVEKEEICGASKIRSLDPNHSDVVEGIRREAVWDSLDVDRMVCSRCESVGRISAIKLPHGIVMKCGQCCFKWILAQPRALLKEGE